ncbi:zinc ribbon domain-containing protein [Anaerolineales bacterium HSG6]|nr:zinc ribbon domain-containing protein [Anaerolineales bacterium HSG6]MDM8531174.1 zinc ribbon domain-containing protein [Anaerolineales bacterium HSG25]
MDFVTLIIIIILIGCALALILVPVWQSQQQLPETTTQTTQPFANRLHEYNLRYETTLANIKELMFDYEVGKISTDDYQALLKASKLEAAKTRQQIDHFTTGVEAANQFALDAKAEMMIKQAQTTSATDETAVINAVEAELKRLKATKIKKGELSCLNCGQPHQPHDAFCAGCGETIASPTSSKQISVVSCPNCGQDVQANDVFCAKCGQSLGPSSPTNNPAKLYLS